MSDPWPASAAPPRGEDITARTDVGLAVVGLLSALAGAVDAYGVSILKDLFVSFMSGNTTSLGMAFGHGDIHRAALVGSIVAVFVCGAVVGAVLAIFFGRYHLPGIVATVAAVLAIPIAFAPSTIYALTFAMGALNASFDRAGNVPVSITFITGSLVKFGRGLGEWVFQRRRDFAWVEQAVCWLGLLSGAFVATLCLAAHREVTILAIPAFALLVSGVLFAAQLRSGSHRH